jgi:hypothetical protein
MKDMILTIKRIVRKVFTFFGGKDTTQAFELDHVKVTGNRCIVEIQGLRVITETFFCDEKEMFLEKWSEFCTGDFIVLPQLYSSDELYSLIIESIPYSIPWKLSPDSHCVRITKVLSNGIATYPLVVGYDKCNKCCIYDSLIKGMMFALYSTMYFSQSCEKVTVYGILVLQDGRMKVYKTTNVKRGPTPIIVYRRSGIKITEDPLEVCDIIEYMIKHISESSTDPNSKYSINQTRVRTWDPASI